MISHLQTLLTSKFASERSDKTTPTTLDKRKFLCYPTWSNAQGILPFLSLVNKYDCTNAIHLFSEVFFSRVSGSLRNSEPSFVQVAAAYVLNQLSYFELHSRLIIFDASDAVQDHIGTIPEEFCGDVMMPDFVQQIMAEKRRQLLEDIYHDLDHVCTSCLDSDAWVSSMSC
ncbi:hypothetical protein Q7P37_003129 [Cladosporium fusiforme]